MQENMLPIIDYNRILDQLVIINLLNVFTLIVRIVFLAFSVGVLMIIIGKIEIYNPSDQHDDWITVWALDEKSHGEHVTISLYYALTTLTTVGFGDFYPTTSLERLVMIVIFVGGVSVFSVFQGSFFDKWFIY
jgi:hypothetical protein